MKSPIVNKTKNNSRSNVRNFSAIIAVVLAAVTLLQASNVKSNELENREMSMLEVELISEIDQFFAEEELSLEEEIVMEMEEAADLEISVYDNDNNLLASGNPENNAELRKLVNQADYLSSFGSKEYYRITK
ncbi:hypothetical protein BFP97_02540 [Roseivirga sp. 4D4]|uniref:hypothetical protein n=1 Tax=Roseivirga sp. 4D4 TaxID=1889784 RepID=UPI00085363B3|nr:hypothetical protein [Roseivirga sp. 4D4]OEK00455.1 hypothetical protein BFP97_02540 [Roseivirga sp. 4D4]